MRAVTGRILSSHPISLSRAARTLSLFSASGTASVSRPELAAYVRRTCAAFDHLVSYHRHLKSSLRIPRSDVAELELEKTVSSDGISKELSEKVEKKKRKGYGGGDEEKRERIVVDSKNNDFNDGVIGTEELKRKKSDKEENRGEMGREEERKNMEKKSVHVKEISVHRKHEEDVLVEEDRNEHHRKKKKRKEK